MKKFLIVLCIIAIGGMSFFGYKYFMGKKTINELKAQVNNLQQIIDTSSQQNITQSKNKSVTTKTIDIVDLMSIFLLPESADYNLPDWKTGAEGEYPINWLSSGIESEEGTASFIRKGKAIVTIKGKIFNMLGKNFEPVEWDIILKGARSGYDEIEIVFPINSQEMIYSVDDILESKKIKYKHIAGFNNMASGGNQGFEIKIFGKKTAWLDYSWSAGSAGVSVSYRLFLNKSGLDSIEYN